MLTNIQGITQYAEPDQKHPPEGVNYVDDSQIYEESDSSRGQGSNRPQSRAAQHNAENSYSDLEGQYSRRAGNEYHQYGRSEQPDHEGDDDDMW